MSTDMSASALGTHPLPKLSGAGLLGIVTSGMYDVPLSMYREYIQNAADAVAGSALPGSARVDIAINVTERRIRIRDNGPGLSPKTALEHLLPIGRSGKRIGIDRGFRGIGRLAGLAFAKTVSFTTRTCEDQVVTRITWHSDWLPELIATKADLEEVIFGCIDVETLPASDYPKHFFEVEIRNVAHHSAGLLLNREAVRDYIGEVCPVPLSTEFPFTEKVNELFEGTESPLTLEVILEGDPSPVKRPFSKSIHLTANKEVDFTDFQVIQIPNIDNSGEAAVGWIAHSPYWGAIPKRQRVRGIRARVGNIQIGDEDVFDNLFTEERFNRWCVGELHILDSRIVPNTNRDYFEPNPHLRNLENQLTPVLRNISTRCRRESTARNRSRRALAALCNIEDLCAMATSGYLTSEDSARLINEALKEVEEIRKSIGRVVLDDDTLKRLDIVEGKLNSFSVEDELRQFGDMLPSEIIVYQKVFGALATFASSPASARELIELLFKKVSEGEQNDSDIKHRSKD